MTHHLPTGYTVQPAQEQDRQAITELIYAMELALIEDPDHLAPEDIKDDWDTLDIQKDTWCIFSPEAKLVAYGTLWSQDAARYGHFLGDGYVHPDYEGLGLGSSLLDLLETRAATISASLPEDTRLVLENNVITTSASARRLMDAYQYTLERVFFVMRINFEQAPALPVWSEGISLHVCDGSPHDLRLAYQAIEEGFQDHFAHTPRTFEEWQRHMIHKDFDPSLWFLAMADDQVVAAALSRLQDPGNASGWLGQLAVRRPWRSRGIGNALLHHTFNAFYQRGVKRVNLGVDSESLTGAQRLYERAGMHASMHIGRYEKELRAGTNLHPGRRI